MKARYPLAALMILSAVLTCTGYRYKQYKRSELTRQLRTALLLDQNALAVRLLQSGADANGRGADGSLLIFHALDSCRRDDSVIRAFVTAGADVNALDNAPHSHYIGDGRVTLLSQIGCESERYSPTQIKEMEYLLKAGADPNLGDLSVIRASSGSPLWMNNVWCNPREVALLLRYGAKLREGDADVLIQHAENSLVDIRGINEADSGLHMMRICATLSLPAHERFMLIQRAIKSVSKYHYQPALEKSRLETLALLRRELHKMQSGPQHR